MLLSAKMGVFRRTFVTESVERTVEKLEREGERERERERENDRCIGYFALYSSLDDILASTQWFCKFSMDRKTTTEYRFFESITKKFRNFTEWFRRA